MAARESRSEETRTNRLQEVICLVRILEELLAEGVNPRKVRVRSSQLLQAAGCLVKNPPIQERVRHPRCFKELVVPKAPLCLEEMPVKPQTLRPVKPRHQQAVFSRHPQAHKHQHQPNRPNPQGICFLISQPKLLRQLKRRHCFLLSRTRLLRPLKPLQAAVSSMRTTRQLTSKQLHRMAYLAKNLQILSPPPNLHLPQAFSLLPQHLLVVKRPLLRSLSST